MSPGEDETISSLHRVRPLASPFAFFKPLLYCPQPPREKQQPCTRPSPPSPSPAWCSASSPAMSRLRSILPCPCRCALPPGPASRRAPPSSSMYVSHDSCLIPYPVPLTRISQGQLALDTHHRWLHQLLRWRGLERDRLQGRQVVRCQLRHRRRRLRQDIRHHGAVSGRAAAAVCDQERQRAERRLARVSDGERDKVSDL